MKSGKAIKVRPEDLKGIAIFSGLEGEGLGAVAAKVERRSYGPGDFIFKEGDEGEELFAIFKGLVSVSVHSGDGEDIELSRVGPGAFFGEMAMLEKAPRSASCAAVEATECLVLRARDFEALTTESPVAAAGVLDRMLGMAASRLLSTGSVVSQMVQFGEAARVRAVTDGPTGLFNRRYLEDSFEAVVAEAKREGRGLSFAMFDLDRFGKLNKEYGPEFCDTMILRASEAFRASFGEGDILVRYGGDEFCFIVQSPPAEAEAKCETVCARLRDLFFPQHPQLRITCSIGLAHFPQDADGPAGLMEKADKALYAAKEGGRDRAVAFPDRGVEEAKRDISRVAQKSRVTARVIEALVDCESFVIAGHKDPDEDCVASMVAFALLAAKFSKKAAIVLGGTVQDNYDYLINICAFNGIAVVREGPVPAASALVLVDTPKPSMIERRDLLSGLEADPGVIKIELDHHLAADSRYWGQRDYRLVYEASSTCEIIGALALKIEDRSDLLERFGIDELLSRNLVLAILSGMIGDSQMGRFLKTRKERWFYSRFAALFEKRLERSTLEGRGNFSTKEEVFNALAALSKKEEACYALMSRTQGDSGCVRYAVLDREASERLFRDYDKDTVVAVAKALVDRLAEASGSLGLVGYYDDEALSDLVQFRLRRSQGFEALDLREALVRLGMANGGGHPGAVGFRLPKPEVADIEAAARGYGAVLDQMLAESRTARP